MSSISLDRIQSHAYIPDSDQTTLDVTKVATDASRSVSVESVKSKAAEVLNTGNVIVQLDPPNAVVSDKVNDHTLKTMEKLQETADLIRRFLHAVADNTGSLAVKIISGYADDFEVELAFITDKLKSAQNKLKIQEVKVAKAKHEHEMLENQEKLKESEVAVKKAHKSGLASKIFGWISSVASLVIGTVMVATGIGAAAGALMVAGGVMGVVSMVMQEPEVQDAMKKAGINTNALNKVMMALEITVAVIGAVVTFGGAAASGIAKLAAKSAGSIAQKVNDIATKTATNMAKIVDMGSKAATTTAKATRFGAETVDLTINVGKGTTDSVHAANNAHVTEIQADITDLRANMTLSQAVIDKLKEEIGKMMADFQEIMSVIMQMVQAKGETTQAVMNRPATV